MIYGIRTAEFGRRVLMEFANVDAMTRYTAAAPTYGLGISVQLIDEDTAHQWVRDRKEHETGLWIEDGEVRYADPES